MRTHRTLLSLLSIIALVCFTSACGGHIKAKVIVPPAYPLTMMADSPDFTIGPNVAPVGASADAGKAMPVVFWDPDQQD